MKYPITENEDLVYVMLLPSQAEAIDMFLGQQMHLAPSPFTMADEDGEEVRLRFVQVDPIEANADSL